MLHVCLCYILEDTWLFTDFYIPEETNPCWGVTIQFLKSLPLCTLTYWRHICFFQYLFVCLLCVWCFACMYLYYVCARCLDRPEQAYSYSLELKSQTFESHRVGAGNPTWVLCRSSTDALSHLSSSNFMYSQLTIKKMDYTRDDI